MTQSNPLRGLLHGGFTVTERPQPLPGDLRIGWGVALVVLVLGISRSKRASLQKLHFLAHLSRAKATREQALAVFQRRIDPMMLSVRVEPWVNRAIAFGAAEGLVVMRDGKAAALTDTGRELHGKLLGMAILEEERDFLADVGRRATEQVVEKIMRMEQF